MKRLNDVDWDKIKLYHGTTAKNKDRIISEGFHVNPTNENNWLGRGAYFAVNNIFLPILFSNRQAKSESDFPAIIEIDAKYLADDIKRKILDLTSQPGINAFHNISRDFINFIKPYEKYKELQGELRILEKHFACSPFYNDAIKPNLIPNIAWFILAIGNSSTTKSISIDEYRIKSLNDLRKNNLTNIIFDWFNYKYSCGIEKDVPIKGVIAHFNTGTPIALSSILENTKVNRSFVDYISYLNRTELSIFSYNYYCDDIDNASWSFNELFQIEPQIGVHYHTHVDIGPIENLLMDSFKNPNILDFEFDNQYISEVYQLLIKQKDWNGS